MEFVKQQISSAVKNASSGNPESTKTQNDKDNNNNSSSNNNNAGTQSTAQGVGQAPDLAKTISQTMANLGAGGKGGSTTSGVDGLHLPADLSGKQLGQLGAAAKAEQAQHPDKSAETIGADTLKRVRDMQGQGRQEVEGAEGGVTAALQGGLHQSAEKEALEGAVEQGRHFLTQQQKEEGVAAANTAPAPAPAAANKPPVTRSKAATLDGDSTDFS